MEAVVVQREIDSAWFIFFVINYLFGQKSLGTFIPLVQKFYTGGKIRYCSQQTDPTGGYTNNWCLGGQHFYPPPRVKLVAYLVMSPILYGTYTIHISYFLNLAFGVHNLA